MYTFAVVIIVVVIVVVVIIIIVDYCLLPHDPKVLIHMYSIYEM